MIRVVPDPGAISPQVIVKLPAPGPEVLQVLSILPRMNGPSVCWAEAPPLAAMSPTLRLTSMLTRFIATSLAAGMMQSRGVDAGRHRQRLEGSCSLATGGSACRFPWVRVLPAQVRGGSPVPLSSQVLDAGAAHGDRGVLMERSYPWPARWVASSAAPTPWWRRHCYHRSGPMRAGIPHELVRCGQPPRRGAPLRALAAVFMCQREDRAG